MTTTYTGSNIGLEYDAATGTWGYKNIAQDFIDTNTFSTADPSFEYVPVEEDDEDEQDNSTVCPPGYIYDETLKQCVPDPNYQNPFVQQGGGRNEPDQPGLHIPSNETKEHWIANANTEIKSGEGAGTGKTGLQLFIDNLDDRGFIKMENGKIIFKKEIGGNPLYQGAANILGHQAKVDKIVHDLQRMGAINAEVTLNDKGDMVYTGEMELSNNAFVFTTYNYKDGIYTGFTTPTGNTFKTTGTFGTAGYISAWDKYMANIMKPFTSTSTEIKKTKVSAGDRMDAEMAIKEKERIEIEKAEEEKRIIEEKRKQEQIKTQEAIAKNEYNQQDFSKRDSSEESGGSYGRDEDRPVIQSKPKPEYSGRPIGNPMGAQTNKPSKPSKPKSKPRTGPDLTDFR